LNDCFFDRDAALCLRSSNQGGAQPLLPLCQPDRCANSVITAGHAGRWQQAGGEVKALLLRRKDLSQNQRHALKAKLSEMDAVTVAVKRPSPSARPPSRHYKTPWAASPPVGRCEPTGR
jgi:hypothetical protein